MALTIAVIILLGLGVSKVSNGILKLNKEIQNKNEQIQELENEARKLQEEQENLKKEKEELNKKLEAKRPAIPVSSKTTVIPVNVEQWRGIVAKYPWPVEEALLTMKLESGGNPRAVSRTDDHGLYQIHGGYARYGEQIYDPEFNIALAYNHYYKNRKWTPWYAVRGILWG